MIDPTRSKTEIGVIIRAVQNDVSYQSNFVMEKYFENGLAAPRENSLLFMFSMENLQHIASLSLTPWWRVALKLLDNIFNSMCDAKCPGEAHQLFLIAHIDFPLPVIII